MRNRFVQEPDYRRAGGSDGEFCFVGDAEGEFGERRWGDGNDETERTRRVSLSRSLLLIQYLYLLFDDANWVNKDHSNMVVRFQSNRGSIFSQRARKTDPYFSRSSTVHDRSSPSASQRELSPSVSFQSADIAAEVLRSSLIPHLLFSLVLFCNLVPPRSVENSGRPKNSPASLTRLTTSPSIHHTTPLLPPSAFLAGSAVDLTSISRETWSGSRSIEWRRKRL